MIGRKAFLIAVALVAGSAVASAQEEVGTGTLEVGGFPAGGLRWVNGDGNTEVNFGNYVYGGGATWYLNPRVAIEAEGVGGIGIAQNVTYHNRLVKYNFVPNLMAVSGNIVVFPGGSRRQVSGYVTGGVGTQTLLSRTETRVFGVTKAESFFSTNVGGGLKMFRGGDARNWGWRADYRLIMVNSKSDAVQFFAQSKRRMGHRFYLGMIYTLKR
jgi:outer membrane protein with beta-barrel domain